MSEIRRVRSAALHGIDGVVVEVEVDRSNQLPGMDTVGLAAPAVREGKNRIRSALVNSGFIAPKQRIIVNLAPARIPKRGTAFDLPIAVGILAADYTLLESLDDIVIVGELGLDGSVRPVPGVLPMVLAARRAGIRRALVPDACRNEAASVRDVEVFGVSTLEAAMAFLQGYLPLDPVVQQEVDTGWEDPDDFCDIVGLEGPKRAAEIAAAGGHNLLMVGSPGTGKTLLARRLPSILPPLADDEAFDVTRIYSVAGLLAAGEGLRRRRPFRSPHHTTSYAGLIGGSSPPRPGEVTLAHHGVLFLDEFPEFSRGTLEALRQPLEDRHVVIARAKERVRFPASFMLVAAMNPCPCGRLLRDDGSCQCSIRDIHSYLSRVSGPMLDRIDLQVEVAAVDWNALSSGRLGESSADVRARVVEARNRQQARLQNTPFLKNADLTARAVDRWCRMDTPAKKTVLSFESSSQSARTYHRVLKVAQTVADLDGEALIRERHVLEAISYRLPERDVLSLAV